jgi:hypothetical protein
MKSIEILLQAITKINFDSKNFNKQDQEEIHLLKLKQDLSQKSTKTDLIQLKTYFDNQIKKLIQLNKQNAKHLQQIKLLKTSTCQAHHIQKILSTNPSIHPQTPYSHQSSRPYITFELDSIRKYQRQALLKTPYGTIPLYRRQAWVEIFYQYKIFLFGLNRQQLIYSKIIHYISYVIYKILFECKSTIY